MNAFIQISRGRTSDYGSPHGLKFSDIESYLNLAQVGDPDMRETFSYLISELDVFWLNNQRRKEKDG